jgi:hypothetical protein
MNNRSRITNHVFKLKNILAISILTSCLLILASNQPLFAQTPTITSRQEVRQEIQTLRQTLRGKVVRLNKATITAISGSTLTVTSGGKTYTVNTVTSTNLRRHFFGKAVLTEFSTNDQIDIVGTATDDTGMTVTARLIRDVSIMKRRGVFFGTISAVSGSTITLSTIERGTQTITVSPSTKYVNQKGNTTTLPEIKVGDKIRIRGLWDKTNNTITEVAEVKDFMLQ